MSTISLKKFEIRMSLDADTGTKTYHIIHPGLPPTAITVDGNSTCLDLLFEKLAEVQRLEKVYKKVNGCLSTMEPTDATAEVFSLLLALENL